MIRVSKSGVGQRIGRIQINCLLKLLDGFLQTFGSSLVPVESPTQVELIGFCVRCVALRQPLLICAGQFQTQLVRDLTRNCLLDGNHFGEFALIFRAPELCPRGGID